jgi:hypothetical protein
MTTAAQAKSLWRIYFTVFLSLILAGMIEELLPICAHSPFSSPTLVFGLSSVGSFAGILWHNSFVPKQSHLNEVYLLGAVRLLAASVCMFFPLLRRDCQFKQKTNILNAQETQSIEFYDINQKDYVLCESRQNIDDFISTFENVEFMDRPLKHELLKHNPREYHITLTEICDHQSEYHLNLYVEKGTATLVHANTNGGRLQLTSPLHVPGLFNWLGESGESALID